MTTATSALDPRYFRNALGQFATGVTIVTTRNAGADGSAQLTGLAATSFNSLSLDPPLILWSLGNKAGSLPLFEACSHYAINVLAADQMDLVQRFSSRTLFGNARYEGLDYRDGLGGAPLLHGCCAWFECINQSHYVEGDHIIFIGRVERCAFEERAPLIFQAGGFQTLAGAAP